MFLRKRIDDVSSFFVFFSNKRPSVGSANLQFLSRFNDPTLNKLLNVLAARSHIAITPAALQNLSSATPAGQSEVCS